MAGRKQEHLNEIIRQKLGAILHREANDPRFAQVTISNVSLSKDRSHANVTVSSYVSGINTENLIASLNGASGFFSRVLGRSLKTRNTPRITFHYDHGFDHAHEIDLLLKSVKPKGG